MRLSLAIALFITANLVAEISVGQGRNTTAAADGILSQLRSESVGTGFTANSLKNGLMQQSIAQPANNGISAAPVTSSSIGTGRAPGGISSKPFSSLNRGSTISPYLGLFNEGIGGDTIDNYNAFVRPQLQQQRFNQSVQRQQTQLNQRVQALSARPAFQPQGSDQIMPTGHQATFGYYSRFYPGLNRRR